jgi:hypothetical protein
MRRLATPFPLRRLPRTPASLQQIAPFQSTRTKATDQNASGGKSAQKSSENAKPANEHAADLQRAQKEMHSVRQAQENVKHIDTQTSEYSKSGSDDAVAAMHTTSFDPSEPTDPEESKERLSKHSLNNPLEVSPANKTISDTTSEMEGGGTDRRKTGGSTYAGDSSRKSKPSELLDEKKVGSGFDRRKKSETPATFAPGSR